MTKRWSISEDRYLARAAAAGQPYSDIAAHLDRTRPAIKFRVRKLKEAGVLRKIDAWRLDSRFVDGCLLPVSRWEVADLQLIDEMHREVWQRWADTHSEWSEEEVETLIREYEAGLSIGEITMKLGGKRTARAVSGKLVVLRQEGRVGQRVDSPPFEGGERPTWGERETLVLEYLSEKRVPYDLIAFVLDRSFDEVWGKVRRQRRRPIHAHV